MSPLEEIRAAVGKVREYQGRPGYWDDAFTLRWAEIALELAEAVEAAAIRLHEARFFASSDTSTAALASVAEKVKR